MDYLHERQPGLDYTSLAALAALYCFRTRQMACDLRFGGMVGSRHDHESCLSVYCA